MLIFACEFLCVFFVRSAHFHVFPRVFFVPSVCFCVWRGRVCSHGTKLFFAVPSQSLRLSDMFSQLEAARQQYNIVEYSLSQTTLEQVRLCVSKFVSDSVCVRVPAGVTQFFAALCVCVCACVPPVPLHCATVPQIFNVFAAQQESERGVARGIVGAPSAFEIE